MSQHDMNIANQGFPAFRSDLNNALAALVSTSSGATEPTTTFANQLWYDTANDTLKIRDESNAAWISVLTLDQTNDRVAQFLGNSSDSATAPSFTWGGDPNTGMYNPAADQIGLTVNGVVRLTISTSAFTGTLPWRGQAGTAAAPAISTSGDTNTGIFFPAADTIAFAEGGVEAVRINSDAQFVSLAGTALLPSLTATGDPNTGVFYPAADTVAITTGGSERLRLASAGQLGIGGANYGTSGQVLTSNGSGAAPSWSTVSGSTINVQSFDASGTWTKPAGYSASSRALVQVWGAGGSGAKTASTGTTGGGGGGGGAYTELWFTLSALGATETVTIGAGGAAVTAANTNGNPGGNTTFGSLLTSYGGGRGSNAANNGYGGGGGGQLSAANSDFSGSPGSPISTDGGAASIGSNSFWGGAGGGGGNFGSNVAGYAGGSSYYGGGGGGGAGQGSGAAGAGGASVGGGAGGASSVSGTAGTGTQPAGGGGGTGGGTSGAGGAGRVIVTIFPA